MPDTIAFIDFEASGLGARSWPIEIGWAFEDGAGESLLVSPAPDWSMDDWDRRAEKLHGISPKMLSDLGVSAQSACNRAVAALADCAVYSDAPDWDSFWMMRLFDAAGRKCPIRILEFSSLMPPLSQARKSDLLSQADRQAPRRHRAGEDALHLVALYRLSRNLEAGG
ncbi:MAG: hypothetical protein R3C42_01705 [Parvularculaceae bacterium]|nr:hypothetical protein [Parvularculaceae bacterium]